MPGAAARGSPIRGRYELVVQEAIDRKRVITLLPECELDQSQIASLVEIRGTWSPDGRFIVIGRPGEPAALLVVLPEQGRVLKTIERASHPAWSPDGPGWHFFISVGLSRLAGRSRSWPRLRRRSHTSGSGRAVRPAELESRRPVNPPGRTEVPGTVPSSLELFRVFLDSGLFMRALPLGSSRPDEPPRRLSVSLDRDQEQCIFLAGDDEQGSAFAFASISRQQRLKLFHPLDVCMRPGAMALSPDGLLVAVRIETANRLAPVLLCNPASEAVTLLWPDSVLRREWLVSLVAAASELLRATVPRPVLDGHPIPRQGSCPFLASFPTRARWFRGFATSARLAGSISTSH